MSRAAQDWAAARTELDPATRWTLWQLADYADPEGRGAFPSVRRLASDAGITERTAQRHLRELEQLRFIEHGDDSLTSHYPANRRPAVWNLRMNPGQPSALQLAAGAESTAPSTAVDNSPSGVTPVTPLWGDSRGHSGVTRMSPKPRTKEEQTRARARGPRDPACGQPGCADPDVGAGLGWLADQDGHATPCPTCKPALIERNRLRRNALPQLPANPVSRAEWMEAHR